MKKSDHYFSALPLGVVSLALSFVLIACSNATPAVKTPLEEGNAKLWASEIFYARPLKTGFLADQPRTSATNGWGPIEANTSVGGDQPGDGRPISIGGTKYAKGLGVHAASSVVYEPSGNCSSFQAVVGLDDEIRNQSQFGSVTFQVWADGAKIWESSLLKVTGTPASQSVNVPIAGKSTLELRVTDGGDGSAYDHADWADARVQCATSSNTAQSYLSDLPVVSSTNGYGPVELDMSNGQGGAKDGRSLTLGGSVYPKGLGVHAASSSVYDLAGNCSSFQAVVGLDDEIRTQAQYGSVRFEVFADGSRVFDSGVMKNADAVKTQNVNVAVTGTGKLELRVSDGGDGNVYDHADWADARVECSVGSVPAPGFSTTLPFSRGVNLAGADFGDSRPLPGTYVTDYIYPNQFEVDYFNAKGMSIYRLPFLWERLQRTLNADFDPAELERLDAFVSATTAKGKRVILDPHNYARYYGQLIGSSAVPNAAFSDFWRRLAEHYRGNKNVVFGLMNEPYSKQTPDENGPAQPLPTAQWVSAANAAIVAIRSSGATNPILVPGTRFSGAWTWFWKDSDGASNADAMLGITDSGNNLVFEVHQYLDTYAAGREDLCVSATIGSERLKDFTRWLRDHNRKGFLGEFSSGLNATCDAALEDTVRHVEANSDVWRGWTYWAAGPYWPGPSLEPKYNQDARQMPILQKFLTPN